MKVVLRNIAGFYSEICDNRVLHLGHLGLPQLDCDVCTRTVTQATVLSLVTQPRSVLADWLEDVVTAVKNEDAETLTHYLGKLPHYVYLPHSPDGLSTKSISLTENQSDSPETSEIHESLFQSDILSPHDFKSLVAPWLEGSQAISVGTAEFEVFSRSKYASAVYVLHAACTYDQRLAVQVANLLLAELSRGCNRLLEEAQSVPLTKRGVDQLSLIASAIWIVLECQTRANLCVDKSLISENLPALRCYETLVCQCILLSHAWKQDLVRIRDCLVANSSDTYEPEVSLQLTASLEAVVDRLCSCSLKVFTSLSCAFQDATALMLASVAIMSACEAELSSLCINDSENSHRMGLLDHTVQPLETLIRCWARVSFDSSTSADSALQRYYKYCRTYFPQCLMWTVDSTASRLKVLSSHTALCMTDISIVPSEDAAATQVFGPWKSASASLPPSVVAVVTYRAYCLAISSVLSLDVPSLDDPTSMSEWIQSTLTVVELLYSEMSCRGFFHIDNGAFSKALLLSLASLLVEAYYPSHVATVLEELQGADIAEVTMWACLLHIPPYITVHLLPTDTLTVLMTLLGQLTFDLYEFPLCAPYYCRNKTDSLSVSSIGIGLLPFLLSFIRFCDDDMGVHSAASKSAYNFLYAHIPELKYPAGYFASVAKVEELVLTLLCSPESSSPAEALQLPSADGDTVGSDNALHVVFCDFFDGLLRCGLVDSAISLSSFPDRSLPPIEGVSVPPSSSSEQEYELHPFFYQQPDEVKCYAHIHLYLSNISLSPTHVEVWFRLYERLHDLLWLSLDDIAFNMYPLQNIHPIIKGSKFASIISVLRVLCGTMVAHADQVYDDAVRGAGPTAMEVLRGDKLVWWKGKENFQQRHMENCGERGRRFVSCLDGIPNETNNGEERSGTKTALEGVILLFAKLNALLSTADNILAVIHRLLGFDCEHKGLSDTDVNMASIPESYAQRYSQICELRCIAFATMSKLFDSCSEQHVFYLRRAYHSSCAGTWCSRTNALVIVAFYVMGA